MLASALKKVLRLSLAIILVAACLSAFSSSGTAAHWPCDTNLSLLGAGLCWGDAALENWVAGDTYCLDANVVELAPLSPDCMIINANNVVLDCYGFSITGPLAGRGITIGGAIAGSTINDCAITNFNTGIMINSTGATNNVSYSTISNSNVGINLTGEDLGGLGVDSTIIQNNNVFSVTTGIALYGVPYEVTTTAVANNTIYKNTVGILLSNASSNAFSGNRIFSNANSGLQLTGNSDSNTFAGEVVNASGGNGYNIAAVSDNNLFSQCAATDNALAYYDIGSVGNWLYNFSVYNTASDATTNFSITSYTGSISINDTSPVAAPPRTSLGSKALAIASGGGATSINYLSIHFTDAERIAAGLTKSTFRIWRFTGGSTNWDSTAMGDSNVTGSNISALVPATMLAVAAYTFQPLGSYITPPVVDIENPQRVGTVLPPPLLTCGAGGNVCCAYGCNGSHYGVHDDDCKDSMVCCKTCAEPVKPALDNTVFVQGEDALKLTGSSTKTQANVTFVFVAIGGGVASLGAIALLVKSVV